MTVYIGADHRGFPMKEGIVAWLTGQGHEVHDMGASELHEGDDYPDYAQVVAHEVAKQPHDTRGILLCGSGVGIAIAANKIAGIRAATIDDVEIAKVARNDDDINVLALGADFLHLEDAKAVVATFLTTPFSGSERHIERIKKISKLENHD